MSRLRLYDSDSLDKNTVDSEDTVELGKFLNKFSLKKEKEGEIVLSVVLEGEGEAVPDEIPSSTVELVIRSGFLYDD